MGENWALSINKDVLDFSASLSLSLSLSLFLSVGKRIGDGGKPEGTAAEGSRKLVQPNYTQAQGTIYTKVSIG